MQKSILFVTSSAVLLLAGYLIGNRNATVAYAGPQDKDAAAYASPPTRGSVPKSYGRLVTAISDSIGTGLVFEDSQGVIRFVSVTGMKEGVLARYDQTPTRGGVPRSYGRLVTAVVNSEGTGLIFEDSEGVIRFVTIAGKKEGELTRN
jgi:hypothetical protein